MNFTEENPEICVMSTPLCGKSSGARLYRAVEMCVEIVEALQLKEIPEKGTQNTEENGPFWCNFQILRFATARGGQARKTGNREEPRGTMFQAAPLFQSEYPFAAVR